MSEPNRSGWRYVVKSLTTEDEGDSVPDWVRIQWLVGSVAAVLAMLAMIAFTAWNVFARGMAFDAVAFGTGFAALLGGYGAYTVTSGVALFMKTKAGA